MPLNEQIREDGVAEYKRTTQVSRERTWTLAELDRQIGRAQERITKYQESIAALQSIKDEILAKFPDAEDKRNPTPPEEVTR